MGDENAEEDADPITIDEVNERCPTADGPDDDDEDEDEEDEGGGVKEGVKGVCDWD